MALTGALICDKAIESLVETDCKSVRKKPHLQRKGRTGMADDGTARIAALEERVEALSGTIKSVLTTLMLRGILTKETVAEVLKETKAAIPPGHAQAEAELEHIKEDLPQYMRNAMGEPEEDDHGH